MISSHLQLSSQSTPLPPPTHTHTHFPLHTKFQHTAKTAGVSSSTFLRKKRSTGCRGWMAGGRERGVINQVRESRASSLIKLMRARVGAD